MNQRFFPTVGFFFLFAGSGLWAAEPPHDKEVDLTWGVKIPLRDDVKLNATVYRPHGVKEPVPAIFTLTPSNVGAV